MSVQALREFINRHVASATGLAALGAVLGARATGTPLEPTVAARIQDLLAALGGGDLLADVGPDDARPFLAELRLSLGIDAKLLREPVRPAGWSHTEPELLQAGGDVSAGFVQPLSRLVVPRLEGLADRLAAPGAAFLDVGVGVAGLSIAIARAWPALQVVGIDPWAPSIALARDNVARAGLGDRIELRALGVEALADEAAFDLAWIPIPFLPAPIVPIAYTHVRRALRPGGWVLVSAINPNVDPASLAFWRLRTTLFGNGEVSPVGAEAHLRDAGFVDVHTLPSPPGAFLALVAGRR